jgi:RNA polymerase sigma-70 factor (ECF subfamily)
MDADTLSMTTEPTTALDPVKDAFHRLLTEDGPKLLAMLRGLCRQPSDADDVFQETAIRVWRNFADRPRLRNPRGWLLTIGYRAYVDWLEDHKRLFAGEDASQVGDPKMATSVQIAEHRDECNRVQVAVEELSEDSRRIVVLHYSGGLTLREIAKATGLPNGTVKSRLNAALTQLRRLLS